FCDKCALGVPKCEDAFFGGGGGDAQAAGILLLPLGDGLVDQLRTECADGFGCAAKFSSCAEQVLANRGLPEETLGCLLDSIQGKGAATSNDSGCEDAGNAATTTSSGSGGAGTSSGTGAGTSSSSSSGGGGAKKICFNQTLNVDNLTHTDGDTDFKGHGPK